MPAYWLTHPVTGEALKSDTVVARLAKECDIPAAVTKLILAGMEGHGAQTNPRPSDFPMHMTCRRQLVWMAANPYGVNPLQAWPMIEGTAIHNALETQEVEVPGDDKRIEVCGVPMRGRIDLIEGHEIVDYKTKSPYFSTKYGAKGSGVKPWIAIWEPDQDSIIKDYQDQLSICGVLLAKGKDIHCTHGRVERIYRGVKAKDGAFKTYRFPLLTEDQLERTIGPWLRAFYQGLQDAQNDANAWKAMPADGRQFQGRQGLWKCKDCVCKGPCDDTDKNWEVF